MQDGRDDFDLGDFSASADSAPKRVRKSNLGKDFTPKKPYQPKEDSLRSPRRDVPKSGVRPSADRDPAFVPRRPKEEGFSRNRDQAPRDGARFPRGGAPAREDRGFSGNRAPERGREDSRDGSREGGFRRPPPREGGRSFGGDSRGGDRKFQGDRDSGRKFEGNRNFKDGPRSFGPSRGDFASGLTPPRPESELLKQLAPLKTDKGRFQEGAFLLEGLKQITDVIEISPSVIRRVLTTKDFADSTFLALLKQKRVAHMAVSRQEVEWLCETEASQGVVAVCSFSTIKPAWDSVRYVTLLDAVQDPGNVGAIFRTSLALGMDAIVLGKGTCEAYNPKVVRSSVGALIQLPFEAGVDLANRLNFLRQKGFTIVATSSHATHTMEQVKLRRKVALIVGNEGSGTGPDFTALADATVKIPLKNVESLNVAVAHGILAYQLINSRD